MSRKRRQFALVYGGLDYEYSHGSFAVDSLNACTPEAAFKEAKRKVLGNPKEWWVGSNSRTGKIEVSTEGSGMLLDGDWTPPSLFVVEILDTPFDAWKVEACALRDEMIARFEKEHVEAQERAELERLQQKYRSA